ncbi:cytochrome bd-I oxidase subunit CydH [Ferrimonas marina]|nr:YnhF family membrane protein [Ferrimonas marina]
MKQDLRYALLATAGSLTVIVILGLVAIVYS